MSDQIFLQHSLNEISQSINHLNERSVIDYIEKWFPTIMTLFSVVILISTYMLNRRVFKLLNKTDVDKEICNEHIRQIFNLLNALNDKKYHIKNNVFDMTKGGFEVNWRIADLMYEIPEDLIKYKDYKLLVDKDFLEDIKFPGFSNNVLLPSDITTSLRLQIIFQNLNLKIVITTNIFTLV